MQTVGAFEAKTHLAALLDQVEHGEQVVITKHGKAVARLMPMENRIDQKSRHEAIEYLKEFRKQNKLNGLNLKQLISEGRH